MNTLIMERGSGKTHHLIQRSKLTGYTIVTLSESGCTYIKKIAKEMEIKIPEPIAFQNYLNEKYRGETFKGLLLDDVDVMLSGIFKHDIDTVTMSLCTLNEKFR